MDRTRLRLLVLVIVHIAALIALNKIDIWYGLLFAQIGLLAIWLALGTWWWLRRLATFCAGTVAVGWLLTSAENTLEKLVAMSFPMGAGCAVAGGFVVACHGWPKLRLVQCSARLSPGTRFQFSLGRLMAVVAAVAIVFTGARITHQCVVAAINRNLEDLAQDAFVLNASDIVRLDELAMYFGCVVVAWAATWACLGTVRPLVKSLLSILLASMLGALVAYCFIQPLYSDPALDQIVDDSLLLASQSVFMIASLLVVRSCGYRLIGRKEMATLAVTT